MEKAPRFTTPPEGVTRYVVCAAARHANGDIIVSPRHNDAVFHDTRQKHSFDSQPGWEVAEQGFIDQWGIFMTRQEAWGVALAAQQLRHFNDNHCIGTLWSENLY